MDGVDAMLLVAGLVVATAALIASIVLQLVVLNRAGAAARRDGHDVEATWIETMFGFSGEEQAGLAMPSGWELWIAASHEPRPLGDSASAGPEPIRHPTDLFQLPDHQGSRRTRAAYDAAADD